MVKTRLTWPARPRRTLDRLFGHRRQTWRCQSDPGYQISRCLFSDFTLVYPRYAGQIPTHHRTLAAAMRAAEAHRNGDE